MSSLLYLVIARYDDLDALLAALDGIGAFPDDCAGSEGIAEICGWDNRFAADSVANQLTELGFPAYTDWATA